MRIKILLTRNEQDNGEIQLPSKNGILLRNQSMSSKDLSLFAIAAISFFASSFKWIWLTSVIYVLKSDKRIGLLHLSVHFENDRSAPCCSFS